MSEFTNNEMSLPGEVAAEILRAKTSLEKTVLPFDRFTSADGLPTHIAENFADGMKGIHSSIAELDDLATKTFVAASPAGKTALHTIAKRLRTISDYIIRMDELTRKQNF